MRFASTLAFLAFTSTIAAPAAAQVFTDRVSFEAALGAFSIETFESALLSGTGDSGGVASLTFSDFRVDTVPSSAKVLNHWWYTAFNTTPGGSQYLYVDTDAGNVGAKATITSFLPTHAIGFDYTSIIIGSSVNTVTVDGQIFTLALNPPDGQTARFFGYISTSGQPLASLTVSTSTNSAFGLDQVTLGALCPNPNIAVGQGCAAPGGFVPKLTAEPCAVIGQPFGLSIDDALGGALAVFFVGTAPASTPLANGCTFLVSPVLPPLFALPLGGVGPGNGSTLLVTSIPAGAPSGAVVYLQPIVDHGDGSYATANAFRITIQ